MNNPGWESGDKMEESVAKETLGHKLGLGIAYFLMAVGAVCVLVMMQTVAVLVVGITGIALGADRDTVLTAYDGTSTFVYGVITIPMLLLYLKIIRRKGDPMFMKEKLNPAQIVFVVVCAFGMMGIVNIYLISASLIAEKFATVANEIEKYSEAVDRYSEIEAVDIPKFDHILNFIGVCILVPITEELTFRAGVLQTLLKRFRPTVAVLLSAAIFGVLHIRSIQVGYALIAGVFLGWVYFYTKSIRSTIFLHILFNMFGSGITTLLQSGLFGDATSVIENYSVYSTLLEFSLIIPAIVCFIFLRSMYKNSIRIDTGSKPVIALAAEDTVENFVPDENAPSPFAPVTPSGEENDEQA